MQAFGRRASYKEDNERKDGEDWADMQVVPTYLPYNWVNMKIFGKVMKKKKNRTCGKKTPPLSFFSLSDGLPLLMFIWQMIALSGSTRRSWVTWRMSTKTWKLSSKCLTLTRSTIETQLSFGIKSISYYYEIDINVGNFDSKSFDVR